MSEQKDKIQKHFEPLKPFKPYESVTFDRLENNFGVHPIVVFLDIYKDVYYYVKARSAKNKFHHKRAKLEYEIKVPKAKTGLFIHDSFIDTSEIYKISDHDLHEVFDEESIYYLETDFFNIEQIHELYKGIIDNLSKNRPLVSLSHVYIDKKNQVRAKTLYACDNFLKRDYDWVRDDATLTSKQREAKKTLLLEIEKKRNKDPQTLKELQNLLIWIKREYQEALFEYQGRSREQELLVNQFPDYVELRNNDLDSYCHGQLQEIRLGLESGVDTSLYSSGLFDAWQMEEIRLALESGLDFKEFADPSLSWEQMREKRKELSGDKFIDESNYKEIK
ncbi:Mbov_0400 family ICE element protein [Mycoplasma sp. 4013]